MKNRVCLLLGLLSLLVVAVFRPKLPPCPVDVRLETYKQIELGMSNDEVEAILGGPAGDYSSREGIRYVPESFGKVYSADWPAEYMEKKWSTDGYAIWVFFGPDGTA